MEVAGAVADSADRDAWLEKRRSYLTASEVAVALGIVPGRNALVRAKAGKSTAAELRDSAGVDGMVQVTAGRFFEAAIFAWFSSETIHTTAHLCGQLLPSPVEPRLAATPDAILDGEPVELKLVGETALCNWHEHGQDYRGWIPLALPLPVPVDVRLRLPLENTRTRADARDPRTEWRRSRDRQLRVLIPGLGAPRGPLKYWVQLQVQMHVLGAEQGWLVGVIGGSRRYDLLYERDDRFLAVVLFETSAFWQDVEELKNG